MYRTAAEMTTRNISMLFGFIWRRREAVLDSVHSRSRPVGGDACGRECGTKKGT
jgi:hypothetical protein